MSKARNTTLNIMKAIACIHVVLIHCMFPEPVGIGVKASGRFAVPLFFCISGYFFSSKAELDSSSILRKLRHVLWLIIGSEIFYIIFSVLFWGLWDPANRNTLYVNYFKQGWIEKYFILGQSPVFAHLWFLYALAVIYALCLFFINTRKKLRLSWLTIPISLISIIFMQEFNSLRLVRNGILIPGSAGIIMMSSFFFFRALPFFLIGTILREKKEQGAFAPSPAKLRLLTVLIIVFQICAIAEGYLFSICQFTLGSMAAMVCMMIFSIMKPNLKIGRLDFIGEKLSMYVYVLHIAVMKVWDEIAASLSINGSLLFKWTRPVVTILLSLGAAFLANLVIEKIKLMRKAKAA